jgi:hypothetical protein
MEQSRGNGVLYLRLSIMMFLQFAVWGAWAVVIGGHMRHLGFTGKQISYVFGTTAFGSLISPLIAGWIADRLMPAQIFTAVSHFVGAMLLFIAWRADGVLAVVDLHFALRRAVYADHCADQRHRLSPHEGRTEVRQRPRVGHYRLDCGAVVHGGIPALLGGAHPWR